LLALGASAAAAAAAVAARWVGSEGFAAPSQRIARASRTAAAAAAEEPTSGAATAAGADVGLRRREATWAAAAAVAAGIAPLAPPAARAEDIPPGPPSAMKRVVISIGSEERLATELKFWLGGCEMKKLSEFTGADGLRSTVVGFGDDPKGFGIEFKLDPNILNRERPSLLNYNVMQPYVDALNFVQVSAKGKMMDVFARAQNNGGNALIGDATHIDIESPRGVQVRFVTREDVQPSVELVSLNVEVPAFDAVTKFYKRSFGMQELEYPAEDPSIQKLSVLLGNVGENTPNLLLCPTPDGRLKERDRDAFESMVVVAKDPSSTVAAAQKAVELNAKEDLEREDQLKIKLSSLPKEKRGNLDDVLAARRAATLAKPAVLAEGALPAINDGVGNIVVVASASDFEKMM